MPTKTKDVTWVARTPDGKEIKFKSEADVQENRPRGSHYGVIVHKTGNFIPTGPRWNIGGQRNYGFEHARRRLIKVLAELTS